MPTNNYPNIGYTIDGIDWNYYQQITVSATSYGGGSVSGEQPDIVVPFTTQGAILTNLGTSGTVLYSFNGNTTHGQLTGYSTTGLNQQLVFNNRVISKIWFKIASGSCLVSLEAWSVY